MGHPRSHAKAKKTSPAGKYKGNWKCRTSPDCIASNWRNVVVSRYLTFLATRTTKLAWPTPRCPATTSLAPLASTSRRNSNVGGQKSATSAPLAISPYTSSLTYRAAPDDGSEVCKRILCIQNIGFDDPVPRGHAPA